MADKNVILKDGEDTLYPKTLLSLVDGMPQPTSADNGKMLGVDNGAYKLVEGGGGSLYQHNLVIQGGTTYSSPPYTFLGNSIIISDSPTPLTVPDIAAYLYANGFIDNNHRFLATGMVTITSSQTVADLYGMWSTDGAAVSFDARAKGSGNYTITTSYLRWYSDMVVQIS